MAENHHSSVNKHKIRAVIHYVLDKQAYLHYSPQNSFELSQLDQVYPEFQIFLSADNFLLVEEVRDDHASCQDQLYNSHPKKPRS